MIELNENRLQFFGRCYCMISTRFLIRKYFLPDIITSVCNDCLLVKKNWSDKVDKGHLLHLAREELNK